MANANDSERIKIWSSVSQNINEDQTIKDCSEMSQSTQAETVFVYFLLIALVSYVFYKLLDRMIRIPCISESSGRYVLVTGCDTGFGHLIARELDRLGLHVFAGCLTPEGELALKSLCSQNLLTVRIDVSQEDSIQNAFKFINANLPDDRGLWAILNNAGVMGALGPVEWLRLGDFQRVLDVNLLGMINVTNTFLPLIKRAHGRVINTASILGRFSMPGCIPYNISKFGVEAFSDGLRRQLRPFGVSVHLIEPGFFKTNLSNTKSLLKGLRDTWRLAPEQIKEEYGKDFLHKSLESIEKMFDSNLVARNLQPVVDAYSHAITGLLPRTRYVVGWDANLVLLPLCYLPEWLTDTLMDVLNYANKPAATSCKKLQ